MTIGSALVHKGRVIGRGHNMHVQLGGPLLHGEMSAFRNADRQPTHTYRECVLHTTPSPCPMCSGTSPLFKILRIIIAENVDFFGAERWLAREGAWLSIVLHAKCIELMARFVHKRPDPRNEDLGV